jgi:hypothetical protein
MLPLARGSQKSSNQDDGFVGSVNGGNANRE